MSIDIRDVAAKYLAYRSHTTWEMRKHLAEKGFDGESIDEVIDDFQTYGYLDDEKYCRQYFEYAFSKGKGKRKVFQELREKGIDNDTIQFAFEDMEDSYDEKSRAREEASKVLRMADIDIEAGDTVSEKLIAKVARRLQSKGYGSDTIYSVIGELRR